MLVNPTQEDNTMCNGWTNRETWLVNLWFGDVWAIMQDDGVQITADFVRAEVEDYLEDILGPSSPRSGFIVDMMDLGAINYDELASHYAPESAHAV